MVEYSSRSELFTGDVSGQRNRRDAHAYYVKLSCPTMTSIKRRKPKTIARLRKMQSFDADIPKDCADACENQLCADVACRDPEMQEQYADCPIITMSMANWRKSLVWLVKYLARRQLLCGKKSLCARAIS
ncbi:hypothetical protein ACNKHN_09875 [Shigella flexneri]